MLEFRHEQEVDASLYHGQDGVVVLVHDEVHLPVPEAFAVCRCRPLMDTDAVSYIGCLCLFLLPGFPGIFA